MYHHLGILKASLRWSSFAIVAPMAFFGIFGWYIDRIFGSGHLFLFAGLFGAFVTTQILLFRKLRDIQKSMKEKEEE